jgi:hypothetical protein
MIRLRQLDGLGEPVTIYPDAEELLQERLLRERSRALVAEIRGNPPR